MQLVAPASPLWRSIRAPMDDVVALLESAREAFGRRDWPSALEGFNTARENAALSADDLTALGDSAWWVGDIDAAIAGYEGAYRSV